MKMMTRHEALELLYEKWNAQCGEETVSLEECFGRILAEDVSAGYSIPMVRASSMDGIAVRSELFTEGIPDTSSWKLGQDYVRADTGDDFDDAYDAVIAIENVELLPDGGVKIAEGVSVEKHANVRPAGSTLKKGDVLVRSGARLRSEDVACIAMSGRNQVKVRKKPVVAFIPTGSELIPAGEQLQRGQNFDANSHLAASMLREMGAEPLLLPIVRDQKDELRDALKSALSQSDIVIINGGSSKGGEDFNTRLLEEEGELICHGVRAVPGRPMGIAVIDGKPVINLSGPVLAAFYGLDWCVRSLVCTMLDVPYSLRTRVSVMLEEDLHTPSYMELLVRMNVCRKGPYYTGYSANAHAENTAEVIASNALFISEIDRDFYPAGSWIEVELCCRPEEVPVRRHLCHFCNYCGKCLRR